MKKHSPPTGNVPRRDPAKEQFWRSILKRFATSGQSIRQFCAARKLKETAFYFWRREIRRRDSGDGRPRRRGKPQPLAFTQVVVRRPEAEDSGLRLRLLGGRELLLPAALSPARVAELLRAIEDAA
jgi:transposase-like protein